MLLPLVMLHIRHVHLVLHVGVSLKKRATHIWSFGCGFACDTTMGYSGFKLLFGTVFVL